MVNFYPKPKGRAYWTEKAKEVSRLYSMRHLIHAQIQFSIDTYGPGTRKEGILDHIKKEIREIEENPSDIKEWIDLAILAIDGAWRCGPFSSGEVYLAFKDKLIENMKRDWPDWRKVPEGKAIEHVRDQLLENGVQAVVKKNHVKLEGHYKRSNEYTEIWI